MKNNGPSIEARGTPQVSGFDNDQFVLFNVITYQYNPSGAVKLTGIPSVFVGSPVKQTSLQEFFADVYTSMMFNFIYHQINIKKCVLYNNLQLTFIRKYFQDVCICITHLSTMPCNTIRSNIASCFNTSLQLQILSCR